MIKNVSDLLTFFCFYMLKFNTMGHYKLCFLKMYGKMYIDK